MIYKAAVYQASMSSALTPNTASFVVDTNSDDDDDVYVNPDVTPDQSFELDTDDEHIVSDDTAESLATENDEESDFDENALDDEEELMWIPREKLDDYGQERDEITNTRRSKRLRSESYKPMKRDPNHVDITRIPLVDTDDTDTDMHESYDDNDDDDDMDDDDDEEWDNDSGSDLRDFIVDDLESDESDDHASDDNHDPHVTTHCTLLESRRVKKDENVICVVCHKQVRWRQKVLILSCGHDGFHAACIRAYMKQVETSACPLCGKS